MTDKQAQPNNPLHGLTLQQIVTELEQHFGWQGLADRIDINCFKSDPSVKSTLKFLRKTQWARDKVEALYVKTFVGRGQNANKPKAKPNSKPNKQRSESSKSDSTNPWGNHS